MTNRRFPTLIVLGVSAIVPATGCSEHKVPESYAGQTLSTAEVALGVWSAPLDGYQVIETEPSQGRFPAAVAVVPLEWQDTFRVPEDAREAGWRIGRLKEEQGGHWNSLFNTLPPIREVLVMDRQSVAWPEAKVDELVASAGRLGSGLCLVYGPSQADPQFAAFSGVLFDTASGSPVATVGASAGPTDMEPQPPGRPKNDLRHEDVNEIAARKFERQVRRCVDDLIRRDQKSSPQGNPYEGYQPTPVPVYLAPDFPAARNR